MTLFLSAVGAAGVALFVVGTFFRAPRLSTRVEPYLTGLGGSRSQLLSRGSSRPDAFLRSRAGARLARFLPSSSSELEARLALAGSTGSAAAFRLVQLTWGAGAVLAVWTLAGVGIATGVDLDQTAVAFLSALSFTFGFLARDWWLNREIHVRQARLLQELPTAIDLVALSVIAGESVVAAFDRAARALGPGIGTELEQMVADVRSGAPVVEALETLKARTPVSGIARFVDAISTAIERGSPLGEVLAAQADDGREARRRMLMELGGKREILMLLPVVFLIMPVVVVFALLPGLVSLDLLVP